MNFPKSPHKRNQANVLLVTMCVIAIVMLFIIPTIFFMTSTQNLSVTRSHSWNAALAAAEAGVEEALAHLNTSIMFAKAQRASQGWTFSDGFYRAPRRTLSDGCSYEVKFSDDPQPEIFSTGYATVPLKSTTLSRSVMVTTSNAPLFVNGMTAQTTIDFKGGIETDSYNSKDPNFSTNGKYDPAKARDHGDVATNSGITNSLSLGNAKIKGHLRTGSAGQPKLGPLGSVGDTAWVDGGYTYIKPGWLVDDMNMEFPDVLAPAATTTPVGGTVGGTNYTYVLSQLANDDGYILNTLNMKSNDKMLVTAGAKAVLYVTGDVLMQGKSFIQIDTGATLQIFVGGTDATFTEVNTSGKAENFQYFGLPSNTSVTWGGNAEYVGTIYAPSATFTMGGGGSSDYDFQGACIVYSIVMNGHFKFHFDESLPDYTQLTRGLVAVTWTEQ